MQPLFNNGMPLSEKGNQFISRCTFQLKLQSYSDILFQAETEWANERVTFMDELTRNGHIH